MDRIAKGVTTGAGTQYLQEADGTRHAVESAVEVPFDQEGRSAVHPDTGWPLVAGTFAGQDCWIAPDQIGVRAQTVYRR